jgi:hypothetical protein
MTPFDWSRLTDIVTEEIQFGLMDAGLPKGMIDQYLTEANAIHMTRTHGRREVAFLNRAWEDVLSSDLLIDPDSQRQPLLNHAVNQRLCRCAGCNTLSSAQVHLTEYFKLKYHVI